MPTKLKKGMQVSFPAIPYQDNEKRWHYHPIENNYERTAGTTDVGGILETYVRHNGHWIVRMRGGDKVSVPVDMINLL